MTARSLRAIRGTAAAASATVLAAVSHTVGGGAAPGPALIATMAILATPLAVLLVGRRMRVWRVGAAVLASQLAFHVAFAVVGTSFSADGIALRPHVHGAAIALSPEHVADTGAAIGAIAFDPLMLVAHVVAAAASFVLLYRGESAARALVRILIEVFAPRAPDLPLPRRRARVAPAREGIRTTCLTVLAHTVHRRGPPVLS